MRCPRMPLGSVRNQSLLVLSARYVSGPLQSVLCKMHRFNRERFLHCFLYKLRPASPKNLGRSFQHHPGCMPSTCTEERVQLRPFCGPTIRDVRLEPPSRQVIQRPKPRTESVPIVVMTKLYPFFVQQHHPEITQPCETQNRPTTAQSTSTFDPSRTDRDAMGRTTHSRTHPGTLLRQLWCNPASAIRWPFRKQPIKRRDAIV